MFNTNGFREFQLTRVARASVAKKAIATYAKAMETGYSFAGKPVTEQDKAWLEQAITDQRAIIEHVKNMPYRVGEW